MNRVVLIILFVIFIIAPLMYGTVRLRSGQGHEKELLAKEAVLESGMHRSNIEWFINKTKLERDFVKKFLVTTVISGEVAEVIKTKGKIGGLTDYYVGEEGYYEYLGGLILKTSGLFREVYFSAKRMDKMQVFSLKSKIKERIEFADIKPGDIVDVEETVDLSVDSINDENVVSLTILVF